MNSLHLISPSFTRVSESNTSIVQRALELSKVLQYLNVDKVIVSNIDDFNLNYPNGPVGKKILVDVRPGDIIQREKEIGHFDMAYLLVHQQDYYQMGNEEWRRLNDISSSSKAILCGTSGFARGVLIEKKVAGIHNHVGRIPIKEYPVGVSVEAVKRLLETMDKPHVVIWLMPSIRKNSFLGALAVVEACKRYDSQAKVTVVNSIYSSKTSELYKYFGVDNVEVTKLDNPSDADLHYAISTATTVVLPSFDEGLNLPLYESARTGTQVIVSAIGPHREAARIYQNVRLVDMNIMGENTEVFGHMHDEINAAVPMPVVNYKSLTLTIERSMREWVDTRDIMSSVFKGNRHISQPWTINPESVGRILGISKRKKPGKAEVVVI